MTSHFLIEVETEAPGDVAVSTQEKFVWKPATDKSLEGIFKLTEEQVQEDLEKILSAVSGWTIVFMLISK